MGIVGGPKKLNYVWKGNHTFYLRERGDIRVDGGIFKGGVVRRRENGSVLWLLSGSELNAIKKRMKKGEIFGGRKFSNFRLWH